MVFKRKELSDAYRQQLRAAGEQFDTNVAAAESLGLAPPRYAQLCRRYQVPTAHERCQKKTPPWIDTRRIILAE